jgi:hypothetical protein
MDTAHVEAVKELQHLNDLAGAGSGFSREYNNLPKDMQSRVLAEARSSENSAYVTNLMIVSDEAPSSMTHNGFDSHPKAINEHLVSKKNESPPYEDFLKRNPLRQPTTPAPG